MIEIDALTIWQPWASLIVEGIKPYEFRGYALPSHRIGRRHAIHAAKRPETAVELNRIIEQICAGRTDKMAAGPALDLLEKAFRRSIVLPHSVVVGTAVFGKPIRCIELFNGDPDIDPTKWAWPMLEVRKWATPIEASGLQGFWRLPFKVEATQ